MSKSICISSQEEEIMRGMESSDNVRSVVQQQLLPGFRFNPTDAELVGYYLKKKVRCEIFRIEVIAQVNIYKFHPEDLPNMAYFGEDEWYFFTPRAKKYPHGTRPNRAADRGYWKATGTDKPVVDDLGRKIGLKKSLVFYTGDTKKGSKSNWIMHEYRLTEGMAPTATRQTPNSNQLDDLVLCRIYEKKSSSSAQTAPSQELDLAASQEHDVDSMIAELEAESATYEDAVDSVQQAETSTSMERNIAPSSSMTMSNFCNSTFENPAATSSWNNHNQMQSMPSLHFNQLVQGLSSQQPLDRMHMYHFHDSNRDVASSSTHMYPFHDSNTDVASSSTHSPLPDDILYAPYYYDDGAMDSFS